MNAMKKTLFRTGLLLLTVLGLPACGGTSEKEGDIVVSVASVSVSPASLSLTEGDTSPLKATVLPADATDYTLTWATTDAAIATVSQTGIVSALKPGSVTVIASAGEKTGSCVVTVNAKVYPVEKVELNESALTLEEEQTATLVATVSPANATNPTVLWSSSDPTVATVDDQGKVTAVKTGTATITAKAEEKSASCAVTVTPKKILVEAVTLEPAQVEIETGSIAYLTATITPATAEDKTITWTSSEEGVATVTEEGMVEGVGVGTATITVTTHDGGKTATCAVTVVDADRVLYYQTSDRQALQPHSPSVIGTIESNKYEGDFGRIVCTGKITAIGEEAFLGCDRLVEIYLPKSVSSIGARAFKGCSGLTYVEYPASLQSMGDYVFENCTALQSVKVSDSMESVGRGVFAGCSKLSFFDAEFLAGTDHRCWIVNGTLYGFASAGMTAYTLPQTVTAIAPGALQNCAELKRLDVPSSVVFIDARAFADCPQLVSFSIERETPPTLSDPNAFANLPAEYQIFVPTGKAEDYKSADGWKEIRDHIVGDSLVKSPRL